MKLIPLGQTAGQRLLLELSQRIPGWVEHATTVGDDDIAVSTPTLLLFSALHETQYTRLFRS